MTPRIAIAALPGSRFDAYAEAVRRAGGDPVLCSDPQADCDGVILPGGCDVDPAAYGAPRHPLCGDPDASRDRLDLAWARRVFAQRLPCLAICRGVQVANVAVGGTLVQDIPALVPGAAVHRREADDDHAIQVDPGCILHRLVGPAVPVNSRHHQAVDRPGRDLRIVARCADGVVEAVESAAHPGFLGVQWHPEDLVGRPAQLALFRWLVRR